MNKAILTGIYTLTNTHCGTGQAVGAVDLPVARESHSGMPFLPATMLKGVARDEAEKIFPPENGKPNKDLERLFGSAPPQPFDTEGDDEQEAAPPGEGGSDQEKSSQDDREPQEERKTRPGALVFTDGRLLLLPIRSLERAFLWVTSRSLIHRFLRDLAVFEPVGAIDFKADELPGVDISAREEAWVSASELADALVLEDLVFAPERVAHAPALEKLGKHLLRLVPDRDNERFITGWLPQRLALVGDEEFLDLAVRAIPVTARTQLTSGKTTDAFRSAKGLEKGNLWYEETLPPECLFYSFVAERHSPTGSSSNLDFFREKIETKLKRVQIGGNETVGQGQCWWTMLPARAAGSDTERRGE
jgi:CRISPR-associated protein Cmr4